MFFFEAVLEAVGAAARVAVDARVLQRVDEFLAGRVRALRAGAVVDVWAEGMTIRRGGVFI